MDIKLLVIFIVLSFVNVILQTVKSLLTINGSKFVSAIANAVAYGLYTVVIIYMNCELSLFAKIVITMVTNFIGVYVSKWLVDKFSKDKLWKIEIAVNDKHFVDVFDELSKNNISFNYNVLDENWTVFSCYCKSQKESTICINTCKKFNGKMSAYESKL